MQILAIFSFFLLFALIQSFDIGELACKNTG
jgi:hypothetical protein